MGNHFENRFLVWVVIGMALVTGMARVLPLTVFNGKKFSPLFESFLKYIPVSIMTAMLVSTITLKDGAFVSPFHNQYLMMSLLTFPIAFFTRNLLLTVFCGIVGTALLRFFALS